jgi:hypothetical protein
MECRLIRNEHIKNKQVGTGEGAAENREKTIIDRWHLWIGKPFGIGKGRSWGRGRVVTSKCPTRKRPIAESFPLKPFFTLSQLGNCESEIGLL